MWGALYRWLRRLIGFFAPSAPSPPLVWRVEDGPPPLPPGFAWGKGPPPVYSVVGAPKKMLVVDKEVWEALGRVSVKMFGFSPQAILAALATHFAGLSAEEQQFLVWDYLKDGVEGGPAEVIDLREKKKPAPEKAQEKAKEKVPAEKRRLEQGWALWVEQLSER